MADKKSLVDDRFESIGAKKGPAAKKNDSLKLIFALVLFLAAGVVFAWYSGLFGGSAAEKPPPETAEVKQAFQEQQKRTEQAIQSGKAKAGGSE